MRKITEHFFPGILFCVYILALVHLQFAAVAGTLLRKVQISFRKTLKMEVQYERDARAPSALRERRGVEEE